MVRIILVSALVPSLFLFPLTPTPFQPFVVDVIRVFFPRFPCFFVLMGLLLFVSVLSFLCKSVDPFLTLSTLKSLHAAVAVPVPFVIQPRLAAALHSARSDLQVSSSPTAMWGIGAGRRRLYSLLLCFVCVCACWDLRCMLCACSVCFSQSFPFFLSFFLSFFATFTVCPTRGPWHAPRCGFIGFIGFMGQAAIVENGYLLWAAYSTSNPSSATPDSKHPAAELASVLQLSKDQCVQLLKHGRDVKASRENSKGVSKLLAQLRGVDALPSSWQEDLDGVGTRVFRARQLPVFRALSERLQHRINQFRVGIGPRGGFPPPSSTLRKSP